MFPESSFWLIIAIAAFTALLPFFTEKSFVFVPWRQEGESKSISAWLIAGRAFLQWFLIIFAAYVMANNSNQSYQLAAFLASLILFALPLFTVSRQVPVKSFAVRIFELLAFYFFVGAIGFVIESYYANAHSQQWQFYAIALCLYIVLAYPGFVYRHLFRNRFNRRLIAQTQVADEM
ncbi:hypothetical protein AAEX37_02114 [Oligella sp. MSHR50489EDL]|uniref:DUF2818 family protein n=1 Tax=Oligella sp. MSHR50489EDL TaxID=3139409 RepID=UPI003D8179E8